MNFMTHLDTFMICLEMLLRALLPGRLLAICLHGFRVRFPADERFPDALRQRPRAFRLHDPSERLLLHHVVDGASPRDHNRYLRFDRVPDDRGIVRRPDIGEDDDAGLRVPSPFFLVGKPGFGGQSDVAFAGGQLPDGFRVSLAILVGKAADNQRPIAWKQAHGVNEVLHTLSPGEDAEEQEGFPVAFPAACAVYVPKGNGMHIARAIAPFQAFLEQAVAHYDLVGARHNAFLNGAQDSEPRAFSFWLDFVERCHDRNRKAQRLKEIEVERAVEGGDVLHMNEVELFFCDNVLQPLLQIPGLEIHLIISAGAETANSDEAHRFPEFRQKAFEGCRDAARHWREPADKAHSEQFHSFQAPKLIYKPIADVAGSNSVASQGRPSWRLWPVISLRSKSHAKH